MPIPGEEPHACNIAAYQHPEPSCLCRRDLPRHMARGRPRYSLRSHCPHGHLRSDNEVRRKTNGTPYCRVCNLESMRRHRQRSRRLIRER